MCRATGDHSGAPRLWAFLAGKCQGRLRERLRAQVLALAESKFCLWKTSQLMTA